MGLTEVLYSAKRCSGCCGAYTNDSEESGQKTPSYERNKCGGVKYNMMTTVNTHYSVCKLCRTLLTPWTLVSTISQGLLQLWLTLLYREVAKGTDPKSSHHKKKFLLSFCCTREMMDVNYTYCNHFTIYVNQTIMLYTFLT